MGTIESFERVALPVCAVNYHHRIVAWNKAAESFFGLTAADVLGREWHSVIYTSGISGCCALCRSRRALREGNLARPVDVGISVGGNHQRVTMLPIPLSSDVDQTMGFMILPESSTRASAPSGPKAPIPINSRVLHLDDRIVETLTAREREVLECIIEGFDARTIAETVGITHATARNYVQRILTKLGARNKAEAVNVALRYNLIAS